MGGADSGYDLRDTENQVTKYNGSGCLIHGLSIVADSFLVIEQLLNERPEEAENLIPALKNNWRGYENLRAIIKSYSKYGMVKIMPIVWQQKLQIR